MANIATLANWTGFLSEIFIARVSIVWMPAVKFKVHIVDTTKRIIYQFYFFFVSILVVMKTLRETSSFDSFCWSIRCGYCENSKGFLTSHLPCIHHLTAVDQDIEL